MTDYKAEPEEWALVQSCAEKGLSSTDCCLLELRSRIERLELGAGIHDAVIKSLKPPSLKEQALAELAEWENIMDIAPDSPIRRALEQLDD
jgi:hypothetical protein